MRSILATALFVASLSPTVVVGQSFMALEGNAGTLGYRGGVGFALSESLNVRLIAAGTDYTRNFSASDVDYSARLRLRNAPVLLDVHPGGGVFRFSFGALLNDDQLDVDAKPSAGAIYRFNNVTYSAAQIGSANGNVSFKRAAPYIGIGFGRPIARHRGWNFAMDIGAAYLGQAKATLTVTCGAGVSAAICTQIQNDANAEAAQLSDEMGRYRWYPVLQMHLTYAF